MNIDFSTLVLVDMIGGRMYLGDLEGDAIGDAMEVGEVTKATLKKYIMARNRGDCFTVELSSGAGYTHKLLPDTLQIEGARLLSIMEEVKDKATAMTENKLFDELT